MGNVVVEINGAREVISSIDAVMAETKAKIEIAIYEAAQSCLETAQANAPVLTGLMRDTMTMTTGDMEAEVETNVDYSKYVEYGHMTPVGSKSGGRFVPAQPFLGPARDQAALELTAELSGLI